MSTNKKECKWWHFIFKDKYFYIKNGYEVRCGKCGKVKEKWSFNTLFTNIKINL